MRSRRRQSSVTCCRCSRRVKPAELNATLTAVATALQGRGADLGHTLVDFDKYLKTFNPHVPKLVDDLNKLGQVGSSTTPAAPDIIATLNNLQTSSRTLIAKQAAFRTVLATATSTSTLLNAFLTDNQSATDHRRRHRRTRSTACSTSTHPSTPA